MTRARALLFVTLLVWHLACGRAGPPVRSQPTRPVVATVPETIAPDRAASEAAAPEDAEEETAP